MTDNKVIEKESFLRPDVNVIREETKTNTTCCENFFVELCQKPKKAEYQCYFISFLPFFYISDCVRCGFCVIG